MTLQRPLFTLLGLGLLSLLTGCYELQIEQGCDEYCARATACGSDQGGLGCEIACELEVESCSNEQIPGRLEALDECAAMSCDDFEANCTLAGTAGGCE